jgi:hypothetical protein
MVKNGDVMRSDRLKQVMQDIDPQFDEKNLGKSKFSKFCQDAAEQGLIKVTKLENGQLEVAPTEQSARAGTAGTPRRADRAASRRPLHPPAWRWQATESVRSGRRGRRGVADVAGEGTDKSGTDKSGTTAVTAKDRRAKGRFRPLVRHTATPRHASRRVSQRSLVRHRRLQPRMALGVAESA